MKKSLNKVIVTLAAVTALTAAMAITASAAVSTTQTTTDGKTTITANVTGKTAGEQVTMLVLKPGADTTTDGVQENEIAYIDQKAADDQGNVTFTMPIGTTTAGETYDLLSGSTSATSAETSEVAIPSASEKIHYGDINGDEDITTRGDALVLVNHCLNKKLITDADQLKRADVNQDGDITTRGDALDLVNYCLNKPYKFDASWLTDKSN